MAEIKKEDVIKVFPLYLGQQVQYENGTKKRLTADTLYGLEAHLEYSLEPDVKLILRLLSDITDKEAIEVAELALGRQVADGLITRGDILVSVRDGLYEIMLKLATSNIETYIHREHGLESAETVNQGIIHQHLLSHGFDIPMLALGGKKPSEAGIAILNPQPNA
jgi:hypothetical protein